MPRLTPLPWKTIDCILTRLGFVFARQKGSHRMYYCDNIKRPIVLPTYSEVDLPIIMNILSVTGISRDKFLELTKNC